MINVHVNPLEFSLANLAQFSLVRSTGLSITVNHSSNFVESCSLKMAISCRREFVRFVCFCVVHSVSVYWYITSLNGSVGAGVKGSCALSVRERFCSPHSSWSQGLCGLIPLLAFLLWLLLIVISCLFLLQVCPSLPGC